MGAEDTGDEGPGGAAGALEVGGGAVAAAHGEEMVEVAEGSGEEGEEEVGEGVVFDEGEEAVAFDVEGFEAGGAAGGEGVVMEDAGGGNVDGGPAGPAGAEAEVGVFAVEEERGVEAAGVGEHAGAEEGGGAGGEEGFLFGGEVGGGLAVAALFAGAVEGDGHAGGVEEGGVFVEEDLGGGGAGAGVAVEGVEEGGEPGGLGEGVVVEDGKEGGGGVAGGEVGGGAEADVGGGVEDGDAGGVEGGGEGGFDEAGAGVIYDHDVEVRTGLAVEGVETVPERLAGREGGDGDGDPGRLQTDIVRRAEGGRFGVGWILTKMRLNGRTLAFEVLEAVEHGGFADELLRARRLEAQEANLANELVFGVLRYRGQLDYLIGHYSGRTGKMDREVRNAMRLGIYQLRYLDRIPAHAAVSTSVEMVKWARKLSAVGFVNAVLRKVNREPVAWPTAAVELSMPEWLWEKWVGQFGREAARGAAAYFLEKPVGYQRGDRQMDIGAQSIVPLLGLEAGQRFLDVCAAPGNKTLQAAESGVEPVACDRSRKRLLGVPVRQRVQLDATQPLPFGAVFDRVLVDAPCSGTGTMGRNPEIKWRVTPEEIARQAERQLQILRAALAVLKPGGRLVYSTCSLEREENEGVVAHFGERVREMGYRVPGQEPGDGFFHAVLA
jgi:16S rRNA (cytosine967-C5)-methyltransferase